MAMEIAIAISNLIKIEIEIAIHSGKCYVVRVGKNLKEYPYDNDFYVIWFVHFVRSSMQIFRIISLPVNLLIPEIVK